MTGEDRRNVDEALQYLEHPEILNEDWWRRRESNPRPKMLLVKRLHAYSRSCPGH